MLNEEGEVAFLDHNAYVVDPNFRFKTDPLHKINWRNIQRLNLEAVGRATPEEVSAVFRQNINDLAFSDMRDEQRCVWISNEGLAAMRVMQLGMQHLLAS